MSDVLDVLIVGAGLSGIGMACHLKRRAPWARYAILEARADIGGTWDLFRYPGVRSDSDMFTLGYAFRPWAESKAIADGPSILGYIKQTAQENGVDTTDHDSQRRFSPPPGIRKTAQWSVEAERGGERVRYAAVS